MGDVIHMRRKKCGKRCSGPHYEWMEEWESGIKGKWEHIRRKAKYYRVGAGRSYGFEAQSKGLKGMTNVRCWAEQL